jgi:hypothetical protein
MSRPLFACARLALFGLALGTGTFAEDEAKSKSEAVIKAKNEAILRKLEKPIPLKVKNVPLEDVLRYVTKATAEPGDSGIPIHVVPAGLARAQVLMTTGITYESEDGEPFKNSLAMLLGMHGLKYRVENGLLVIDVRLLGSRVVHLLNRDPQTKMIRDRLEEKVDLTFEKTPLEDVLKFVKKATSKGPDDKGISIYVDPVGLHEAEKTLTTPVSFVAKGEPLKSSLKRLVKSIDLTYMVKDGLLTITSASDEPVPVRDAQDKREKPW